jgi:hypothetical protein
MGKIFEFLTKLADNAHFGKLATDLAPGIVITIAVMFALDHFTTLEVFPYTHLAEYEARTAVGDSLFHDLERRTDSVRSALLVLAADTAVSHADTSTYGVTGTVLTGLEGFRAEYLGRADSLRTELRSASSLTANLDVFADNFILLFIIAFIIGVLMAQVSGSIFYNGTFYTYFKDKFGDVNKSLYAFEGKKELDHRTIDYYQLKVNETFITRLPDIRATYFRYLEVAMNMVLPTGLLAVILVIIWLANGLLANLAVGIIGLVAAMVCILLYRNARELYVGYQLKKADVLMAVQEEGGFKAKLPAAWKVSDDPNAPKLVKMEVDRKKEEVTIENVGDQVVDLSDWRLVSVSGNQEFRFPCRTTLAVNGVVSVVSGPFGTDKRPEQLLWTRRPVWKQKDDPAELYDQDNRLITRVL